MAAVQVEKTTEVVVRVVITPEEVHDLVLREARRQVKRRIPDGAVIKTSLVNAEGEILDDTILPSVLIAFTYNT